MSEDKKTELEQKKTKILSLISIAAFLMVLVIPTIVWGIGMYLPGENFKALDYDLGEKRNKAEFPQQFTSTYGTELEAYYNDRLPFRSVIITANRKLTWALEKPYDETISPYLVKVLYSNGNGEQEDVETIVDETVEVDNTVETDSADTDTEHIAEVDIQAETESKDEVAEQEDIETGEEKSEEEEVLEEVPEEKDEESEKESESPYPLNTVDTNYLPPKIYNNNTLAGRDGWLFYANKNALNDYVANNILSDSQMNEYLSGMINLQQICTSLGKQLYFIIPPNKEQIYSEKMPSYIVADNYKRAQRLIDYVQTNSDIKIVYPINELQAAKTTWQPYFKTDTHWTELGAYIGVQSLYGMMGIPTIDIQNLAVSSTQYLGGDLVLLGNLNQENYADDIRYHISYKPEISVTGVDGSVFIDNIYRTVSTSSNPSKLVLVGDSFRLFMAEYLSRDFSSYTHIYMDNIEDPVAVEAFKNADIIVIESVERLNDCMPEIMNKISGVLQQ